MRVSGPRTSRSDRLGVRESIIGRMHRHGGRAEVRRVEAGGTEVRLELPAEPGGVPQEAADAAASDTRGE